MAETGSVALRVRAGAGKSEEPDAAGRFGEQTGTVAGGDRRVDAAHRLHPVAEPPRVPARRTR